MMYGIQIRQQSSKVKKIVACEKAYFCMRKSLLLHAKKAYCCMRKSLLLHAKKLIVACEKAYCCMQKSLMLQAKSLSTTRNNNINLKNGPDYCRIFYPITKIVDHAGFLANTSKHQHNGYYYHTVITYLGHYLSTCIQ